MRAKAAGALAVVDNTVLSPALQRPIALGADLVVSSLTKMINGHSDMVGGVVCAADPDHVERLSWWANAAGAVGGRLTPFWRCAGCAPCRCGRKPSLSQRWKSLSDSNPTPRWCGWTIPALRIIPVTPSPNPSKTGSDPLMSLELTGGEAAARQFVQSLELFILAQSLGGVESLCAIPATMTHAAMTPDARREAGVTDGLVRLSVGLEAPDDLWADLEQALDAL